MNEPTPRRPLLVECLACKHVWASFWIPISVASLSGVKHNFCPMCGCTKRNNVMVATGPDAVIRYRQQMETELATLIAIGNDEL